jgi:hypothetical protein
MRHALVRNWLGRTLVGASLLAPSTFNGRALGADNGSPHIAVSPTVTPDGGFALEVAKRITPKGSKVALVSTGLTATYDWGDKSSGEAMVIDRGVNWQLLFPEKPPPEQQVTLELQYFFGVDKAALDKVVSDLRAHVVGATLAALDKTKANYNEKAFQQEFTAELRKRATKTLSQLDKLHLDNRASARGDVLRRIGIDPESLQLDTVQLLKVTDRQDELNHWTALADDNYGQASKVACLEGSKQDEQNVATLLGYHDRCWAASSAADAGVAAARKSVTAAPAASQLEALVAALESWSSADTKTPMDAKSAVSWPIFRATAVLEGQELTTELTKDITLQSETYRQQHAGQVFLTRSLERSRWDVATGIVYTGKLDDTIMPILVAFCPTGCLRADEAMWDSGAHILHSISIDVGTRAAVLDNKTDPRHAERAGFLVGASINPFYFLRASGGAYMFDNAESNKWNTGYYAGATINMIHAAEFLGQLGMVPPKIEAKSKPKQGD